MPVAPLEKKKRIKCENLVKGIRMSINSAESMWISCMFSEKKAMLSSVLWVRK